MMSDGDGLMGRVPEQPSAVVTHPARQLAVKSSVVHLANFVIDRLPILLRGDVVRNSLRSFGRGAVCVDLPVDGRGDRREPHPLGDGLADGRGEPGEDGRQHDLPLADPRLSALDDLFAWLKLLPAKPPAFTRPLVGGVPERHENGGRAGER